MAEPAESLLLHASTVALDGRALVIRGASGSGKSSLALTLMALGASLVSDDGTRITRRGETLWAEAPDSIAGRIEARGIGILAARPCGPAPILALVDLDRPESDRLPPERIERLLGLPLPLILRSDHAAFAPALIQLLKGGRLA